MSTREERYVSKEEIAHQREVMNYVRSLNEGKQKKAFIETYGCQQNVSDSEKIAGMLCDMGYSITDDKNEADFIIYNTCAVRENAELKVYGNLGALKHLKAKKEGLIIAVCGCMMQQESVKEQIKKKYKHVDIVFGTHSLYRFPEILAKVYTDNVRVFDVVDIDGQIAEDLPVKREQSPCAWVSVMYGCNNFCSYCIVPYVRGRERSRKKEHILEEVRLLAQNGTKEITLLGQNVNSYGNDLDENIDFADLLEMVCATHGIERVRFMTSHPKDISDKLIDTMAKNKKICKQLHLPFQAGNDRVLKTMNRKYTKAEYLDKIRKIKEKMPSITLTTDIIVGFPGETNEEFLDTLDVLKKVRYDSIFSFIYSRRPGTPASKMEDVITPEEKKQNFDKMLILQDAISKEKNLELEGRVLDILVEGESKNNPEYLAGRTEGGKTVNFKADKNVIGKIIPVKIVEAKTWSLTGEIV
jgi:tRNA-2-methylthio-N6-dimethylallyladenosine synthase